LQVKVSVQTISAPEISVEIALGHSLNAKVAVGLQPPSAGDVVLERSMPCRAVSQLIYVQHGNPVLPIARHAEAHRIGGTFGRQAWAVPRVAQVAAVFQFLLAGFHCGRNVRSTSGRTAPLPSIAERQPPRMRPHWSIAALSREEKRTSHLQDTHFPAAILFALPLADHDFLSILRPRH